MTRNADLATIESFGDEWGRHRQDDLEPEELERIWHAYFRIFPWEALPHDATGFDMGCGSGRWARLVAPRVGHLHLIDAATTALGVARENLAQCKNVSFHHSTTDSVPLAAASCDFGYSLGVLHHIPNTESALADCVRLLRSGAPFLLYLYYRFDNRPLWYRLLWHASEVGRAAISRLPPSLKNLVTDLVALGVYWPLARGAALAEKLGMNVENFPLIAYRHCSFVTMKTDARDRFGTPLEQRFTKAEIKAMMERCGLKSVRFSDDLPYWVACGIKA